MNRPNLLAGLACLVAVVGLASAFGSASLAATPSATGFVALLLLAGGLFLLAATDREVRVASRRVDLHNCSGLGDVAVGLAILAGLHTPPSGTEGVVYVVVVVLGGTSAVLFGVVGLAEKYDRL